MRVAIVGGGVIGMATAVAVKNAFPGFEVKVFAETFSPHTTGDGSAGLWGPYLLGDTPSEDISRWAGLTHAWLEKLWKAGLAPDVGLTVLPVSRITSQPGGLSNAMWIEQVYGAHRLNEAELRRLNAEHGSNYKDGWHFVTYTSEPERLLPWLMESFASMGGETESRKVRDLRELAEEGYELIINCAGLGARELIGDEALTAVRGQVARVRAHWLMHCYIVDDDDGNYIIPNIDNVVLGGTHQEGDFDCSVRKEDSKFIFDGCARMEPALKTSEVLKEWVGLRPGRPRVRLEFDNVQSHNGRDYRVIHNYGHGGAGVTLCWGCALDVVRMIRSTRTADTKSNI